MTPSFDSLYMISYSCSMHTICLTWCFKVPKAVWTWYDLYLGVKVKSDIVIWFSMHDFLFKFNTYHMPCKLWLGATCLCIWMQCISYGTQFDLWWPCFWPQWHRCGMFEKYPKDLHKTSRTVQILQHVKVCGHFQIWLSQISYVCHDLQKRFKVKWVVCRERPQ